MKFCTMCGTQLRDDAKFCSKCGAPCNTNYAQLDAETITEPVYNTVSEEAEKVNIADNSVSQDHVSTNQKKPSAINIDDNASTAKSVGKNNTDIIIAAVIFIAIIGFVIFLASKKNSNTTETKENYTIEDSVAESDNVAPSPAQSSTNTETAAEEKVSENTVMGDLNNYPQYKEILSDIYNSMYNGTDYHGGYGIEEAQMTVRNYGGSGEQYEYSLIDIDGDGSPELIISDAESGDLILAMYTLNGNEAVQVIEGWGRNRYYLLNDNTIYNFGSGGAADADFTLYKFNKDNNSLDMIESYNTRLGLDNSSVDYYHSTNGLCTDATLMKVSEDEASDEILGWTGQLESKIIPLNGKRIIDLPSVIGDLKPAFKSDKIMDPVLENTYKSVCSEETSYDEKLVNHYMDISPLSQEELNSIELSRYQLWDSLLNQLWASLKNNLDADKMERLTDEQRAWLDEIQLLAEENRNNEYLDDSQRDYFYYDSLASSTMYRVEDLLFKYFDISIEFTSAMFSGPIEDKGDYYQVVATVWRGALDENLPPEAFHDDVILKISKDCVVTYYTWTEDYGAQYTPGPIKDWITNNNGTIANVKIDANGIIVSFSDTTGF